MLKRMPDGPDIADSGVRVGRPSVQPRTEAIKTPMDLLDAMGCAQMGAAEVAVAPGYAIGHGLRIAEDATRKWYALGKQIGVLPYDNMLDAGRHAEWMNRTAREIDPDFARLVGWLHETFPGPRGNTPAARQMDEHNNRNAVAAAEAGRRPTWAELQLSLDPRLSRGGR